MSLQRPFIDMNNCFLACRNLRLDCKTTHLLSAGVVHMAELEVHHCAPKQCLLEG